MDDQYTFENKTYKDTYRHTTSHILAQAMKRQMCIRDSSKELFYIIADVKNPFLVLICISYKTFSVLCSYIV